MISKQNRLIKIVIWTGISFLSFGIWFLNFKGRNPLSLGSLISDRLCTYPYGTLQVLNYRGNITALHVFPAIYAGDISELTVLCLYAADAS